MTGGGLKKIQLFLAAGAGLFVLPVFGDDLPDPGDGEVVAGGQLSVVAAVELGADGSVAGGGGDAFGFGDVEGLAATGVDKGEDIVEADEVGDFLEFGGEVVKLYFLQFDGNFRVAYIHFLSKNNHG